MAKIRNLAALCSASFFMNSCQSTPLAQRPFNLRGIQPYHMEFNNGIYDISFGNGERYSFSDASYQQAIFLLKLYLSDEEYRKYENTIKLPLTAVSEDLRDRIGLWVGGLLWQLDVTSDHTIDGQDLLAHLSSSSYDQEQRVKEIRMNADEIAIRVNSY